MNKPTKGQRGFTLIELIVVIAILGVLAAIAVPAISDFLSSSKQQAFKAEQSRIQSAVDAYYGAPDNTRYTGKRQYPLIGRGQTDQALARIHRKTTLGTVLEEARGCSSESGIMVLEQKTAWKQGAPNRCCHRTIPTGSASSLMTTAWWPMPACSCRPPSPSTWA